MKRKEKEKERNKRIIDQDRIKIEESPIDLTLEIPFRSSGIKNREQSVQQSPLYRELL